MLLSCRQEGYIKHAEIALRLLFFYEFCLSNNFEISGYDF
jgi:hypothetical protein